MHIWAPFYAFRQPAKWRKKISTYSFNIRKSVLFSQHLIFDRHEGWEEGGRSLRSLYVARGFSCFSTLRMCPRLLMTTFPTPQGWPMLRRSLWTTKRIRIVKNHINFVVVICKRTKGNNLTTLGVVMVRGTESTTASATITMVKNN